MTVAETSKPTSSNFAAVWAELGFDSGEDAQVQVFQPILARVEPVLFVAQRRQVLVVTRG